VGRNPNVDLPMERLVSGDVSVAGLQLASQGSWEDAFKVDGASKHQLDDWLTAAGPDVAIEAIFHDSSKTICGFVGLRGEIADSVGRLEFWRSLLEQTKPARGHSISQLVDAWVGQDRSFLNREPDRRELGVFNQWRSAGAVILESDRLTASDFKTGPVWLTNGATAPICLELVWKASVEFWVAEVVSHLEGGRHFLNSKFCP
jgi:hypothetical protein